VVVVVAIVNTSLCGTLPFGLLVAVVPGDIALLHREAVRFAQGRLRERTFRAG